MTNNMTRTECYELAQNLGWDPTDKEDTLDSLRINWKVALTEEEVQMTYEALVEIWNEGKVENASGTMVDYALAVDMMDDDLREELHMKLAPCTDQEFFTAYEEAHEKKFDELWEMSKRNPVV